MGTCARCELPSVGKSKYCAGHRAIAREEWKNRISEDSVLREERVTANRELWRRACDAASAAWDACEPTPMVVTDVSSGQRWHVADGVCGFASVVIRPGNSSLARWLSKIGAGRPHYYGGLNVSVYDIAPASRGSQSYDRKVAACRAAVSVLAAAGVKASVDSRLD